MLSLYVPFGGPSCTVHTTDSVTSKKSPNGYKSCPKMTSLEKLKILTSLQKLPENVGDLDKLIVAKFQGTFSASSSTNLINFGHCRPIFIYLSIFDTPYSNLKIVDLH